MSSTRFIKNSRQIRYIIFFLTLFMMIFSIRTYINHFNIVQQIEDTKQKIEDVKEERYFKKKFYSKYLETDYAKKFLRHESKITKDDQMIVRFDSKEKTEKNDAVKDIRQKENIIRIENPRESWHHFIYKNFFE